MCVLTHTEKKKKKIPSEYGQQNGRGCSMVLYMALLMAFSLLQAEKKRKKVAAGRWGVGMTAGDDGRGAGARAREGGGRLVVVVVRVCGATTIKVCLCTAFVAVDCVGVGYFCTVPTLHRRRRWIVAGGGDAGGRRHGARRRAWRRLLAGDTPLSTPRAGTICRFS